MIVNDKEKETLKIYENNNQNNYNYNYKVYFDLKKLTLLFMYYI